MQAFYAKESHEDIPLGSLVETWKDEDFPQSAFKDKNSTSKKGKYSNQNYRARIPNDEIEEDMEMENFDRESSDDENPEKQFAKEEKWKARHHELINAKQLLSDAMKEANDFIENDKNIDSLATHTHKQKQLNRVDDINAELDEIEKMVNEQNESNIKNKRVNESLEELRSSQRTPKNNDNTPKRSVVESSRDPFDKLADVARSVTQEEIAQMRKTAKSSKNDKRKPWNQQRQKVVARTDYNQEKEQDDDVDDIEDDYEDKNEVDQDNEEEQDWQSPHTSYKKSPKQVERKEGKLDL